MSPQLRKTGANKKAQESTRIADLVSRLRIMSVQSEKSRCAFTLIELVVVIIIVAILSATILLRFRGMAEDAEVNATLNQLMLIEQAALIYQAQTGTLPKDQNQGIVPTELRDSLSTVNFRSSPLGGLYDWNGPGTSLKFVGISIMFPGKVDLPKNQLQIIDKLIDDGDFDTGYVVLLPRGKDYFFQLALGTTSAAK